MPEGVEIKISAELIRPLIINKNIINISLSKTGRYKSNPPEGLEDFKQAISSWRVPMRIEEVSNKGKFMYWRFTNDSNNEDWYLFCTFGMSGQFSPIQGKHPCITFEFSDMTFIHFNDARHFGTIKFVQGKEKLQGKLKELGWDPLTELAPQTKVWLDFILTQIKKPIGQVLMNQAIFAGVGNYIRAESLYLAKISPWRFSNQLTQNDKDILYQSIIDVMQNSYQHQGATILTYKDAYGAEGKYSSCFKVYGKKLDPLGNKIIKEDTPDKRTIHWCPSVQV